jgi:hypothetical protein
VEGENFGVSVGMSQEEAIRILADKGFRDDGLYSCTYTISKTYGCIDGERIDLIGRTDIFKDEVIDLVILNNRVNAI